MTAPMLAAAFMGLLASRSAAADAKPGRSVQKGSFGQTADGATVELFTLRNARGLEARIANFGATVVSLRVPDRTGAMSDVVLGWDELKGYLGPGPYFGAVVGRYGNRIAHARFDLDGVVYTLARNNGENALHGGLVGFDKKVWTARESVTAEGPRLELTCLSKDGEEGYPGNLTAKVTYTLTEVNELRIDYEATTDRDTVLNLTNHSYFNLAGQGEGDILGHQMTIAADRFTPVDGGLIPTGELRSVAGTPLDFRKATAIGARIEAPDEQIRLAGGYDHNFVLNGAPGTLRPAARVGEPRSGRVLEVLTTEPGVQFYTGNFLDGSITGKGGKVYKKRYGFCLETQHFPDSPNKPEFPTTRLRAGETYRSTTVFRFSTAEAR
jgi:aldose 1-epimerase